MNDDKKKLHGRLLWVDEPYSGFPLRDLLVPRYAIPKRSSVPSGETLLIPRTEIPADKES